MHTTVSEKLRKIVQEIDDQGRANLTRLTVLKKWFQQPDRARAFALWLAARISSTKRPAGDEAATLFREVRALLKGVKIAKPALDAEVAGELHDRLKDFQNEHVRQHWGPVRIVRNWDLMLVESSLAIYLWYSAYPSYTYKLASDYCQHYDSRYGNALSGPSRAKIEEIIRFVTTLEAREAKAGAGKG